MRLESAHITNFKLLTDVSLTFSRDLDLPLTVIRAENGSGKTSILHALRWAMYGDEGIPQGMRLTSTAIPPKRTVSVQVRVEFTTSDPYSGKEALYRLIRTCDETLGDGDSFHRTADRLRLLRRTDRGEEDIEEGKRGEIAALLPLSLADVFFTNGDDVQRFIAGGPLAERERQDAVHKAIRQLLGLDDVEAVEARLSQVARKLRRELAATGGEDLKTAQEELDEKNRQIEQKKETLATLGQRIVSIEQQIRADERELDGIKGMGDLETIQARIHTLRQDISHLEREEANIRTEMKDLLSSEDISRSYIGDKLGVGLTILEGLANRNVIPGHSVEVLRDRLQLGKCICGVELSKGNAGYIQVSMLIDEQQQIAPRIQQLTKLWHHARHSQGAAEGGRSATESAEALKERFTKCCDMQLRKGADLQLEEEKRSRIDEERIQDLTQRIYSNGRKRLEFERQVGDLSGRLIELEEMERLCRERVEKAERQDDLNKKLRRRSTVARDLHNVATGTLTRLKCNYIRRVSSRMNDLFLDIVGADPGADANVFTGVSIAEKNHDIVIHTLEGRTLDADTELNGASQRALTLSFIWALMEVAKREAPRIIDTPLGMTSGAVKQRMVELLSHPVTSTDLPYQVVLFMTRSEIRDIESTIKDRAGVITTLTCSKDFPRDLVNNWSDGTPTVRICECDHMQICTVCERRQDVDLNRFTRRKEVSP